MRQSKIDYPQDAQWFEDIEEALTSICDYIMQNTDLTDDYTPNF